MPKGKQDDHWDFLAADLGAKPQEADVRPSGADEDAELPEPDSLNEQSTESATDHAPEQPEPSPQAETRRDSGGGRVISGFGYRRGPVDWANLARELGVEAIEEVSEPIPTAEVSEPRQSEVVETVGWEAAKAPARSETGASPPAKAGLSGFGAGILDDAELIVPVDASADVEHPQTFSETAEHEEERKGRRRRRRRKPKSHPEEGGGEMGEAVAQAGREPAAEEAEQAGEGERSHRHGRRRGSQTRPDRQEDRAESAVPAQSPDDAELAGGFENDLLDRDGDLAETGDLDLDGDETDSRRGGKKITHRGIPSWQEAVGFIIDSNMEARSKRDESGGARHRPPRRRGGDKAGNRDRF